MSFELMYSEELNDIIPFDELSKIESRFKNNIKTKIWIDRIYSNNKDKKNKINEQFNSNQHKQFKYKLVRNFDKIGELIRNKEKEQRSAQRSISCFKVNEMRICQT